MPRSAWKRRLLSVFPVLLIFILVLLARAGSEERSKYFELDNGLKVFLYQRGNLPLVSISVSVNLGSKDETEETNGLVHILEHIILFGGTQFRTSEEVSQDIRRHGAYFNAHTSRDVITFDISLPSEYADFALENQKEILFNLKISREEVEKEKKVILEEIAQIKDDPIKYATNLVFQHVYKNHPYQYPIYGRREVIESATVDKIEKLYKTYFTPQNCSLAVVGDFKLDEMDAKVRRTFAEVEKRDHSLPSYEKASFLEKTVEIEHKMDVNLGYLVIGMSGPDFNHPDQYGVDVLVQILGRGVAPMLGYALRGRRNLAYSAHMAFYPEKYGGAIIIYISTDPEKLKPARSETIKFLKNSRRERYSKEDFAPDEQMYILDFLESAKNQLSLGFYEGREKSINVANSLSRFLILNESEENKGYLENIEAITSSDLRKIAGRYLARGKYVIVSILPSEKDKE
ncbi:MAG: M16 family metallopeptidase [Candidatus Aminicenantales bacterium]